MIQETQERRQETGSRIKEKETDAGMCIVHPESCIVC